MVIKHENSIEFMISPELARIVAHISGDGYIGSYKQRRSEKELLAHPRKNKLVNRWYVRYVNTEPVLIEQFIQDAKKEFNRIVVSKGKHEYELSGKWIYELLTKLGAGKSQDWFIPEAILTANDGSKIEWIKAFFDDEAHVSKVGKRITLNMINKKGLKQVQKLLSEWGIDSTLNGPYKCREFYSYHLSIYRDSIIRYAQVVGFAHPKKKSNLKELVEKMNGSARI